MLEDSALRLRIYDEIVRSSEAPSATVLARHFDAREKDVRDALRRLHDAHMLALQPSGEVLMANPFSAVPTPFVTEAGSRRWFGNCIWDALGILATLHADGRVLTGDGIVHFALPVGRDGESLVPQLEPAARRNSFPCHLLGPRARVVPRSP